MKLKIRNNVLVLISSLISAAIIMGCSFGREHRNAPLIPQARSFSSIENGYAWMITNKGKFWRTKDSGRQWDILDRNNSLNALYVSFVDKEYGYVLGAKGKIWRTINGGDDWTQVGETNIISKSSYNIPIQINFINRSFGWLIGASSIWYTDNGGEKWIEQNIGEISNYYLAREGFGWIVGESGKIYSAKNYSKTWGSTKIYGIEEDIDDIRFIDEKYGWVACYPSGLIYYTKDGGANWLRLASLASEDLYYIKSIYFIDTKQGWAVGHEKLSHNRGIILSTNDGGVHWAISKIEKNEPFFDRILFENTLHGWLFGNKNLYKTADGGKSWQLSFSFTDSVNVDK